MEEKFNILVNIFKDFFGQFILCLELFQKGKNISIIDIWIFVFQIFVGIYIFKFSVEVLVFMKYGEVVRDLVEKGVNWIYYDINFCYLRQKKFVDFFWGNIYFEFWIRFQQFLYKNNSMFINIFRFFRNSFYVFIGYCRKFYRGGNCVGCLFKYECYKCY